MNKVRLSRWAAASLGMALLVTSAVTGSAALADPGEATHLDSLVASVNSGAIQVAGQATFVDSPALVAEDPAGDAAISAVGADVTGAIIARPNPAKNVLEFTFTVADQESTGPAILPAIIYTWPITVDDSSRQFFLEARSASLLQPTSPSPAFVLMESVTGGVSTVATLNGAMGGGTVRWEVPMNKIGATADSVITQGGACVQMGTGFAIPGVTWGCNNTAGDQVFMESDYTVPGPTVQLGVAPAVTAPEVVELTASATVQATGAFSGVIPAPATAGEYVVVAKACYRVGNCELRATNVTI